MKINKILLVVILLIMIIIVSIYFISKNKKLDVYSLKIQDGFVPEKIENCTNYQLLGGIKYSVENAEEAISYIEDSYNKYYNKNSELLKLELVDDEDYYYSIFKSYKSNYNDIIYENTYVFFKRDIIDIENKQINLNKVNNKDKIKTIFNIYNYVFHYENAGYQIEKSNIKETDKQYIYTIYFYEISYGDYGLKDQISYCKQNILVDRNNGKYTIENKEKISEFEGKYNPNPLTFY